MVFPDLLIQIAWVIIIARCGYRAVNLMNSSRKPWFEILFYISVVLISLSFLLAF
ncbi:hypothetical protein [Salipaludibacillus aurantiacus]|uniref:Uncharacterized protein n=1 Tax=Salipaludibacillus aurantiacus TaxID=1601833 RepID=A0A1H9VX17_9BACI|nr:hypothetical protein [Salipaludibacillus aurantiacus]SES26162.1 hypothetical protein SAMN05518684_11324 [Salipaludibacillus aurantiacus]